LLALAIEEEIIKQFW